MPLGKVAMVPTMGLSTGLSTGLSMGLSTGLSTMALRFVWALLAAPGPPQQLQARLNTCADGLSGLQAQLRLAAGDGSVCDEWLQ